MNLVSHQGWWSSQDWSYRKNNVVYLHVFFFLLSLLYQNKEDVSIARCNLQNKQDLLIPDSGCQPWANSSTGQKEEQLTYICSSVFMKRIFIFSSCHYRLSYFNEIFNKFTSLSLWPAQMNCTKRNISDIVIKTFWLRKHVWFEIQIIGQLDCPLFGEKAYE